MLYNFYLIFRTWSTDMKYIYTQSNFCYLFMDLLSSLFFSVDGNWGEWSEYCNTDVCRFYRQRSCNNPEPEGYGAPCEGADSEDTGVTCNCISNSGKSHPGKCSVRNTGVEFSPKVKILKPRHSIGINCIR